MSNGTRPAFPINPEIGMSIKGEIYPDTGGLTKREWFAGLAMGKLINSEMPFSKYRDTYATQAAEFAVIAADALIATLEKAKGSTNE